MATRYKHKRSSTPDAVPEPEDFVEGEILVNIADGRLFLNTGDGVKAFLNSGEVVSLSGSGQEFSGELGIVAHDYGKLSVGNIVIDPELGHFGVIERDDSSNEIQAPSTPPDTFKSIRILIVGTSSSGSPAITGFDNADLGDEMPGEDESAWLHVDLSPYAMTAKIEAIDY